MTKSSPPVPVDRSWEFEKAPRISRRYVILVAIIYVVWLAFLGVLAIQRWYGGLQ